VRNGPYELVVAPAGYPGKRYRGRYVYEHQLVWWQHTGDLVPDGYVIHHVNERKRDNRFANLRLESRADHTSHHEAEKPKAAPVRVTCGWCEQPFELARRAYAIRIARTTSGQLFCCKSHQVKQQQARRRARAAVSP
jgi:hypothetical protein